MRQIKAKERERLDEIVFREYKTLKDFGGVLEANPHLQGKTFLNDCDIINLPIFKKEVKKEVTALW